ncbi:MAG: hypothetical protein WC675_02470 [Patescibacteria group bacterium]|jgi:hypothetical protein
MTINGIQKIIDNSGNTLHSQVITFLRSLGWYILVSPYYNDNQTAKPREIDIIAEKRLDVIEWEQRYGFLIIQLFIECKYINNSIVFWFDNKNTNAAEDMIVNNTCLPHHKDNITIDQHHHFEDKKVAKLFSSSASLQKLHENEEFYRALNQTLNGMVYYKNRGGFSINPKPIRERYKQEVIHYPIILCNNFEKIFRINIGEDKYSKLEDNYFELEVNYSYITNGSQEHNEYFLIDVVDFTKFEEYLKKLAGSDFKIIQNYLRNEWGS